MTTEPRFGGGSPSSSAADPVDALARSLVRVQPTEARLSTTRADLLRSAARTVPASPPSPMVWAAALAAVAAVVALGVWLAMPGDSSTLTAAAPPYRGSIEASDGAVFEQTGAPGQEVVRLTDGVLRFEVAPLGEHEYFRVTVGQARVAVRGTVFHVVAVREQLQSVAVSRGRVEVRPTTGELVVLEAGDQWVRPVGSRSQEAGDLPGAAPAAAGTAIPGATKPRSSMPSRTVRAHSPDRAPVAAEPDPAPDVPGDTTPSLRALSPSDASPEQAIRAPREFPGEQDFGRGWSAYEQGNYGRAAVLLEQSCRDAGSSGVAEDACFWWAMSLEQAGRIRAARGAFATFLKRWPASARSNEARVSLGWLQLRAGQRSRAQALFESAAQDPVPSVRASAVRGLNAVRAAGVE